MPGDIETGMEKDKEIAYDKLNQAKSDIGEEIEKIKRNKEMANRKIKEEAESKSEVILSNFENSAKEAEKIIKEKENEMIEKSDDRRENFEMSDQTKENIEKAVQEVEKWSEENQLGKSN